MAYFEWGDDLSVDNALIDDDHRKLVSLVNELHTATSRGEGREIVGEIIAALITYTQEHFQREERHMEALRYSKFEEHKRQHKGLLEKVLEMQAHFNSGHLTVAAQVSTLLRDWLSIHIRREDKEFAREAKMKDPGGAYAFGAPVKSRQAPSGSAQLDNSIEPVQFPPAR